MLCIINDYPHLQELFDQFLQEHCEISAHVHASLTEIISAFYNFIRLSKETYFDRVTFHELFDVVISCLKRKSRVTIEGFRDVFDTRSSFATYYYVCGVKVVSFPTRLETKATLE